MTILKQLVAQLLLFIRNLYAIISSWLISRGYTKQTWAAIIAFISITLVAFTFFLSVIFAPPIATFHYDPFANQAEYEQFLEDNPLFLATAPKDQPFTLDRKVNQAKVAEYTFTLTSRPLKPEMSADYLELYFSTLDQSQQKALDWIRSKKQDPAKLYIRWQPNPSEMRRILLDQEFDPIPQKSSPSLTPSPTPTPTPRPTFNQ